MPETVPPVRRRDAHATRERLLDAATTEFAAHGIAGARVERITAAARANKSQLYGSFGSKDGLFEAVLKRNVDRIVDAAPLVARDLPAYAVSLYDAYLAQPDLVRLATWNRLERRPAGGLFANAEALDAPKLRAIAEAQAAGLVRGGYEPADVHTLVIAMSMSWSAVSVTVAASSRDPEAVHRRRRHALADAVRGAFGP